MSAVTAAVSPITGWTRDTWAAHADRMLLAVRPHASAGHGRITLPGAPGGYGTAVDGLEGFARTFLLAGFRLAGEHGADPLDLAGWYADGLAAGSDADAADRWVRPSEHGQAKVEAASLALVLDLTRPWLWDRLGASVQRRLVGYLAEVVGDDGYPRSNWVWFRIVVETFLHSVGGPWSARDLAADLAVHDSFRRGGGWYADGDTRGFDHYSGWALHLYPTLWSRMAGVHDLPGDPAAAHADVYLADLDRYLADAVHLVGADGGPLVQGRSLTYRFAAAAPFWVGALAGVPSVPPGLLRRAASGIVAHFADHGAPDADGLLTLGWHGPWRALAQAYSGTGSPYWAAKGMLGLALPADHPAWTAVEEPLPVERGDVLRRLAAPGWVVQGTRADGLVRVCNHGTDHQLPGSVGGDSPLYARLGYSTGGFPLLDAAAWDSPLDGAVTLLDAAGRASHRTGMELLGTAVTAGPEPVGVAASRGVQQWIDPDPEQHGHGMGPAGRARPAGTVTVLSLLRGPWELRLVRADAAGPDAVALRVGGWAADEGGGLRSAVLAVAVADAVHGSTRSPDATPTAPAAVTPWVRFPVSPGTWRAVLVSLEGPGRDPGADLPVSVRTATAATGPLPPAVPDLPDVEVRWPDGVTTPVATAAALAAGG